MFNLLTMRLTGMTQNARIALGLFLFTVCSFTAVSIFVGSLDGRSLEEGRGWPFTYPVVHSDSEGYTQLAVNMLEHGVYSASKAPPFEKEINWAPGYPLLIAGSLFLFKSTLPVVMAQILLAGITAVIIYHMSLRFVRRRVAVLPAMVYALDPSIAYYTGTIHTDGLFASLLTIIVYALFFTDKKYHSLLFFFMIGILLGYSSLVRTISQYLIFVLPLFYALSGEKKAPVKLQFLQLASFLIGFVLIVMPWMLRNHTVFDSFTLGNIGPKMLLHYYVKDFLTLKQNAEPSSDFAASDTARDVALRIDEELTTQVETSGGTKESHYGSVALTHIFADPIEYAKFHTIGTLPYFLAGSYRHFMVSIIGYYKEKAGLPHPVHENVAHKMTSVLFSGNLTDIGGAVRDLSFVLIDVAWRLTLLTLALFAFLVPGRRQKLIVAILWLLIGYFAFLTGPAALTRYRIVSEPIVLTLAAIGGWHIYVLLRAKILLMMGHTHAKRHVS